MCIKRHAFALNGDWMVVRSYLDDFFPKYLQTSSKISHSGRKTFPATKNNKNKDTND
ncbi:hypothetical protein GSP01_27280 [Gluconobacter sphaericus NBRC 12467]|nr:hypothetical protein GSP01_27280 [Gluconobacter sphaericus NBRC 12467]